MIRRSKHLARRRGLPGIGLASAVCLGALVPAAGASPSAAPASAGLRCVSSFEATVRQGPNPGSLKGTLTLKTSASGRLSGVLVLHRHRLRAKRIVGIRVSDTVKGNSLTLVIRSGANRMTGTGTSARPIKRCKDIPHSGTLTGPHMGDTGDWLISKGSVVCRPSGGYTYFETYEVLGMQEEVHNYVGEELVEVKERINPITGFPEAIIVTRAPGFVCGNRANFDLE
jgi:hypothetical protein